MCGQPKQIEGHAAKSILQHVKVLQVLLGRKPNWPHTYGAREQQVPTLKWMVSDQGTQVITRLPTLQRRTAWWSDGSALFAAARTAHAASKISKTFWSHAVLNATDEAEHTPTRRSGDFMPMNLQ